MITLDWENENKSLMKTLYMWYLFLKNENNTQNYSPKQQMC